MEDKLLEILDENILNEINVRINSMEVKISGSEGKTLCDPMECSLPGSSVHEIFQARILECVSISFSKKKDTKNLFTKQK